MARGWEFFQTESWGDESSSEGRVTSPRYHRSHVPSRDYLFLLAVAEALPTISLVADTLPAAEHRTYQLFFGCAYG